MSILDPEPGDGFRRNLGIVLALHVAVVVAVWLFNRIPRDVQKEQITWLDGSALGGSPSADAAPPSAPDILPAQLAPAPEAEAAPAPPPPDPEPVRPEPEPQEPAPIPIPKPTSPPKPVATPTPAPKVAPTPKPTARPVRKKQATPAPKSVAKSTPKPKPRPTPAPATKREVAKTRNQSTDETKPSATAAAGSSTNGGNQSGAANGAPNGSAHGTVAAAQLQNYFASVGEEFRGCWSAYKPVFGEGSGGKLTALVRVRISSSGSVIGATLTRSTGNQEVDVSIRKAFSDFKRVPAPPPALLQSGVFESDMAVILSI